jgi:HlyD family secretion protein
LKGSPMPAKTKIANFFIKFPFLSRLSRKGAWITLTVILLAVAGGFAYYQLAYLPSQTASSEPEMQTAIVRQGDLVIYASGTGTLVSNSEATFGFDTSGQVAQIHSKVGDQVEAGQSLAELTNISASLSYEQAKRALAELTSPAAIATAKQAIATAKESLSTAKQSLEYIVSPAVLIWEERLVEAQAALAAAQTEVDANPSEAAKEKLKEAQITLKIAEVNLREANKNYVTYVKENFTETTTDMRSGDEKIVYYIDEDGKRYTMIYAPTEAEIDVARATYELAKATLAEAETYLAAINGDEIPADATGASLSALQAAKDNLLVAQEDVASTQLISPISGTVMSLDFNVGDIVSSSSTTVTIADLTQPYLEVFLDESDWVNINLDYEVEVTFDILPDRVFSGKVVQVDPGLYTSNNSSVVRAIVKLDSVGASFHLPLGTSASVDVIGGRAENAILVPVEALRQAGDQYTVFVVENGELKLRVVKVGIQDLLYAEILSGLELGDIVSTGITETK